ncbi:DUF1707 and DUF4870 domain-containing protein [Actinoallomurus soli]|uniref:DUF1707 and DUF4870 domain-containing protein n=1 Tax=Actinoallomurus soli TaxID=2952535 RepID=UPI0020923695|nr:DUF1707 and DUF4870 domain-containing protein [Actinoallomurus soli]MCO5974530.1 DUF1707 and DUF4870 domain-containing protein [Actinoallomurus soli]
MTISTPPGALRVSAAEREPIVDRLQQAFAEGRLDKEELDLRLHLAMTARTRADLDAVLADLAPAPRAVPAPVGEPTAEQRVLAALAHVLGATTLFLGPLVMLCTRARRSPYVRRHIVEALNFQLTLLMLTVVTFGIGAVAYAVSWIVCGVAALLGLAGTSFRYPFTLRLVR